MSQPLLHAGMHPDASDALRKLGIDPSRIVQTLGGAVASAGTHLADGKVNGVPYCAAIDFSIHHPTQLDSDQIKMLLDKLASGGFAGYYRNPGHDGWPSQDEAHIHAVYAGVPMKLTLRAQLHNWLATPMLNGLASHAPYQFWKPQNASAQIVRTLFLAHNPMNG